MYKQSIELLFLIFPSYKQKLWSVINKLLQNYFFPVDAGPLLRFSCSIHARVHWSCGLLERLAQPLQRLALQCLALALLQRSVSQLTVDSSSGSLSNFCTALLSQRSVVVLQRLLEAAPCTAPPRVSFGHSVWSKIGHIVKQILPLPRVLIYKKCFAL